MDVNFIHQEIKNNPLPEKTKLIADFIGHAYSINKVILDNNNSIVNFFVLEVNSSFEEYFNLKKKDIVGKKITELFQEYENEKEKWNVFFSELTLSGVSQVRLYLRSLNRKVILFAVREDESLFNFFIKDIESGNYQINAKQSKQEIKPGIFLETSTDAIVISQFDNGLFLMVNKGFSRITGYTVAEIIGKKSEEINIWANKSIREQIMSQLWKDNSVSNIEARFLKKDGEIIEGLLSANLIEYNGIKCVLSITKDITSCEKTQLKLQNKNLQLNELKEQLNTVNDKLTCLNKIIEKKREDLRIANQKAEEADRLKRSFLANISHETRTPLNAIIGFAQLLKNNQLPSERQKENLEIIYKSGLSLLDMINNIIDLSKIDSGVLSLKKDRISLYSFLQEILDSFKYKLEGKKICFLLNIISFGDSGDSVLIDQINTRRVLNHLINNAIKFTHKGNIELGCKKLDKNRLLFFVKDTGVGIPEACKEIIFERFRQTDESFTRQFGGLGLGLPIAKSIVNKIGGDIWFTSKINNGTTFNFTIPYNDK